MIEAGRHAVVALTLDLPPELLDVNVHPAKTELRFQDAAAIRSLVIGGLRATLGGGAGPTLTRFAPRPQLHLVSSRPSPLAAPSHPPQGFAEAQLPYTAGPAARALPLPAPAPSTRSAPPSPSCWTPTSSPSPPPATSCSSISTPPMNA